MCGSHEHPSPAATGPTDVSADDETEAEAVVRGAEDAVGRLELQRERLRGRRSTADHAAGASTVEAAQEALDVATARCAETAASAEVLEERQAALTDLEVLHVADQAALTEARARVHTLDAQLHERAKAAERLSQKLVEVVGDEGSVTEHCAAVGRRLEHAQANTEALRRHAEAVQARAAAVERLDQLVAGSVFATVRQVRDALRSDADVASAEALNRAHGVDRTATQRVLADPDLLERGTGAYALTWRCSR